MATTHQTRCGICGRYVQADDREHMLQAQRWEWDEALVDQARAANAHGCIDRDPLGVAWMGRLIAAGLVRPTLAELIGCALERKQHAGPATWIVFTNLMEVHMATTFTYRINGETEQHTYTTSHGGHAKAMRRHCQEALDRGRYETVEVNGVPMVKTDVATIQRHETAVRELMRYLSEVIVCPAPGAGVSDEDRARREGQRAAYLNALCLLTGDEGEAIADRAYEIYRERARESRDEWADEGARTEGMYDHEDD